MTELSSNVPEYLQERFKRIDEKLEENADLLYQAYMALDKLDDDIKKCREKMNEIQIAEIIRLREKGLTDEEIIKELEWE